MRIVIDTNVVVSAIVFGGQPLYFQIRSARKESAEGHWGLAPSVLQLTL